MPKLPLLTRAIRCLAAARPEELRFAARAWLLAPLVELHLAVLGFQPTLRFVGLAKRMGRGRRVTRRVDVAAGRVWTARAYAAHRLPGLCLARSIVQHSLHAVEGTPSRLVVGVRYRDEGTRLEAHAWIAVPRGRNNDDHHDFQAIWTDDALGLESA